MIIQISNIKGGCGKSTLTINLAALLAQQGKDVIIVDADRQGSSSNWVLDRQEDEKLARIQHVQVFDNIRPTVMDLAKRYEYVLVDTGGTNSREMRTGMTAANWVLLPFRPSQPDLDVLPHLKEAIEAAQDTNPDMKVFAVISQAPSNPSVKEIEEARDYLADYSDLITLLNAVIYDRKIYRDAMSAGRGVVEMNNPKAAQEIQQLWEEIHGH